MQEINETKRNKKQNKNKSGKQAQKREQRRQDAISRQQVNVSQYETAAKENPKNKELKEKVEKARLTLKQIQGNKIVPAKI